MAVVHTQDLTRRFGALTALDRLTVDFPAAGVIDWGNGWGLNKNLAALDGPANFRDLGGYRTAEGHLVRQNQLVRLFSVVSAVALTTASGCCG